MSGDALTSEELLSYALNGGAMPPKYVHASPATTPGPAGWRLLDAAHISTGIMDPNRLGSGATGAGNLYLADDGTWKPVSSIPGSQNLQQVTDLGNTTTNTIDTAGTKSDYFLLDTLATPTLQPGMFGWNDAYGTADLRLKGNNVTLQLGQETLARVVNKTGADLLESEYKVVRVRVASEGGAQGQRLAVVLAQGLNDPESATTLGIVTENIANNQEGFITVFGNVNEINTTGSLQGETWVDGDVLYLSPTIPGGLTKVKPVAPQHMVIMGYVVYAHANQGKIFVKVDNGYELDELHNVLINGVANNDLLQYDGTTQVWKNKTISAIFGGTPLVTVPTLQQVTTAGAVTTNAITVGGLTVATNLIYTDVVNSRVGIGTTSPSSKLQVEGLSIFTNSVGNNYNENIRLPEASAGYASIVMGGAVATNGTGATVWSLIKHPSGNGHRFSIRNNSTDHFNIFTNGNLSIGTNTDLGYKLNVSGSAYFNGTANTVWIDGITRFGGTNSYNTVVTNAGSVGIGTTSPSYKLTVAGSDNTIIASFDHTLFAGRQVAFPGRFVVGPLSSGYPEIGYNFTTANSVYTKISNDTAWGMTFGVSNRMSFRYAAAGTGTFSWTEFMSIANTGNVLINTTTDSGYKLNVNGTAYIGGVATLNSDANITGNVSTPQITARKYYQNADGVPTNNLGTPTVTEMALFDEQFDNKTAFYPAIYGSSILTFETYDGTTWTDISSTITDTQKRQMFGGDTNSSITIPYGTVQYQITINNPGPYVYLNALYAYWSSNGHSTQVQIWKKHNSGSWTQHTSSTATVSSWPGHLYLPFSTIPWHPTGTLGTHYHQIRVVFIPSWNPTYSSNSINLYKTQWWGGYPASKRVIYTTNENRGVSFPADLTTAGALTSTGTFTANSTSTLAQLATFGNSASFDNAGGSSSIVFKQSGTNRGILGTDASIYRVSTSNIGLYVYGANDLELSTNGNKRLIVKGGGNILIGTTTDAGYKLDVSGSLRISDNAFFCTGSGNVSIGTTAVAEKFNIASGNIKLLSGQNTANAYRYIGTEYGAGNGNNRAEIQFAIDGSDTNTRLSFHTAAGAGTLNERMRITSAGNVLVGITTTLNSGMISAYAPTGSQAFTAQVANNAYSLFQGFNSAGTASFYVTGAGNIVNIGNTSTTGTITGGTIVKSGGTSSQFLKADGSVDSNAYMLYYNGAGTLDYNSITTNGVYRNQGGANGPDGGTHTTMFTALQSDGNYGWQLAASASDNIFFRYKDATFGSWVRIASRSWVTSQNYLTSYTETDTLNSVTGRGATTTNAITVGGVTVATNLIYTDTVNSRVGIGTSTPGDKFSIVDGANANIFGRITANGTNASAAWVAQNDQVDNVVYRVFGSGVTGYQMGISLARSASLMANLNGTGLFLIGTYSGTDLVFGTANNENMRISNNTGNVLIGTNVDVGNMLDVVGTINGGSYSVGGVPGWSGIINIPTFPPVSITVTNGIITNVL